MNPFVRRALAVVASGFVLVVLLLLGQGLGALLYPADPVRPEPAPAVVARPAPAPAPPPVVTPPPPPAPAPAAQARAPDPPAAAAPVLPDVLPLATRLEIRRELVRGIGAMDNELSGCPAGPVLRQPESRAAVVLELLGGPGLGSVRVTGSSIEAEAPVNDRFVACVRRVLEGRAFSAPGAKPGARLRMYVPLAPAGNALSLSAASLTEVGAPP
ncbi:MAG TPA: hypothetical protein VMH40_17215 [Myxococcaceae bacterium]|nr:hypothetical protein [Myxococcaceae bacterium]